MKIKSLILLVAVTAVSYLSSCSIEEGSPLYDGKIVKINYTWEKTADSLQESTYNTYLSANTKYFKQNNTGNNGFNYWWNAHVLDVFVDGYMRTNDDAFKTKMKFLLNGLRETNGGTYINDYYDDMEWLGLSSLRAYKATGDNEYLNVANLLWTDIKTGINAQQGGGVAWRKSQLNYKNTPANAPAIILACRLYETQKRAEDLQTAQALYTWLKNTLVDPNSGQVWDGINSKNDGAIDKNVYTYNQGVFVGAGLELYKNTGNNMYLVDAVKTANNILADANVSPGGLLKNENQGDGGLFKGILVRYLTLLALEPAVKESDRTNYIKFLKYNAETFYTKAISRPGMLVSPNWSAMPGTSVDLSTQLSGLMLLEAAATLKKQEKI
ncbi:glycoside hydrolase family 76 protein [Desertivirga arenae]|uniref:glycoside hydrolase family 76 protein n=1 Tax=Desertivirga arenae TaxID=2810309 RepID=UPI001A957DBE|nr:glycoside hydrolase family 76 protein [Pedobacter sp. SYSU D00823]